MLQQETHLVRAFAISEEKERPISLETVDPSLRFRSPYPRPPLTGGYGPRAPRWREVPPFNEPPPECTGGIQSRDNHNGNVRNGDLALELS